MKGVALLILLFLGWRESMVVLLAILFLEHFVVASLFEIAAGMR